MDRRESSSPVAGGLVAVASVAAITGAVYALRLRKAAVLEQHDAE